jgi:hypothetical protein
MVVARQAVVSPSSNNRRSYFAPAIAEVADARSAHGRLLRARGALIENWELLGKFRAPSDVDSAGRTPYKTPT